MKTQINDTKITKVSKSLNLLKKYKYHAKIYEASMVTGKTRWGTIGQFETKKDALSAADKWSKRRM